MLYAKRYSTSEPEIEVFGKPTASTFDYAKELLERRSGEVRRWGSGDKPLERVYMIGGENIRCRPKSKLMALVVARSQPADAMDFFSMCVSARTRAGFAPRRVLSVLGRELCSGTLILGIMSLNALEVSGRLEE